MRAIPSSVGMPLGLKACKAYKALRQFPDLGGAIGTTLNWCKYGVCMGGSKERAT